MRPSGHIIVSLGLGAGVWAFAGSLSGGVVCFLAGVVIDVDHIIDYIFHYGWRAFTLSKCYRTCIDAGNGNHAKYFRKLHFFFHTAELAVLLWLVALYTKNIYIFSAALGYSGHIFLDALYNRVPPGFYFFFWRFRHKFVAERLLRQGR